MSKVKTEVLGSSLSDFLKYEATPQTRVSVAAPVGTKAGKFVDFPLRGKKLLALTDEEDGKVIIQPYNCIVDLSAVATEDVKAATATKTLDALKKEGDAYGIVYLNGSSEML